MNPFIEQHRDEIGCVLSCFDRVVITGTLPDICHPRAMAGYLSYCGIRLFDYARWAEPLREEVRANAERLAAEAGLQIECVLPARLHESPPPVRYRGRFVLGDPEARRCHCHIPQPRPIWRRRLPLLPAGAIPLLWVRGFPKRYGRGRLSWPGPMGWAELPRYCGWTTSV